MRLIQMHERTDPDDVFVGTRPPIEGWFKTKLLVLRIFEEMVD